MRPIPDPSTPLQSIAGAHLASVRAAPFTIVVALLAGTQSGCINAMVMAGKTFFGDSQITSPFEQRTGVSLCDGERSIVFVCTAPGSASSEFDSFAADLQDEVQLQLKRHGVTVVQTPRLHDALGASGDGFDRDAVARAAPDADYILHADIEQFSGTEEASPDLLRGRADGMIYAYEVHRSSSNAGNPRVLQVFYKQLHSTYPASHPLSADQVSSRVFSRQFVEHLGQAIGCNFYDVPTVDAFR